MVESASENSVWTWRCTKRELDMPDQVGARGPRVPTGESSPGSGSAGVPGQGSEGREARQALDGTRYRIRAIASHGSQANRGPRLTMLPDPRAVGASP